MRASRRQTKSRDGATHGQDPLTLLKTAGLMLALTTAVAAQEYPVKPVRVIVPFPPGGVNDTVGRMIATQLSERLGKQFVVDNRSGAASVIGSELAANAPKDGYTLLVVSLVNAVNPWLYKLPYDPISILHADRVPRHRPERARRQSGASGQVGQGAGRARQAEAGQRAICLGRRRQLHASGRRAVQAHRRRRSPARAVQGRRPGDDRRGRRPHQGRVRHDDHSGAAYPLRQAQGARDRRQRAQPGAARRSNDRRSRSAGLRSSNWIGIVAPAGTPAAIVAKLHKEISAIQDSPEVQKHLAAGRGGRADELGRVRRLHGQGNGRNGSGW